MKKQTTKNLDKALDFLYGKQKEFYTHDKLKKECFEDSSEIDVQAIINKLDKDGFLHYGGDGSKTNFKISTDGCLLKERGGYKNQFFWDWPQRHQIIISTLLVLLTVVLTGVKDLLCKESPRRQKIQLQVQEDKPKRDEDSSLSSPPPYKKDSAKSIK